MSIFTRYEDQNIVCMTLKIFLIGGYRGSILNRRTSNERFTIELVNAARPREDVVVAQLSQLTR